jgi:predicted phosphatase
MEKEVRYLGHILSEDGIRADPRKIQSLIDWQFPTNATGMLQFLGLANYFSYISEK